MTTAFQPTQVTYDVDSAGTSALSGMSSTEVWGPGQGYPYAWDRFLHPRLEQPGTWRAVRYNWRTGGVVLQLGTDGNFGPAAQAQAGWVRRGIHLAAGFHDLRITFRMGPVTERPNAQYARGQVFARLVPNIPYVPEKVASAQLPAGNTVNLQLSTAVPGSNYDLYVGCSNLILDHRKNPYCEVIVDDVKVQHTFSPYPYLHGAEEPTEGKALKAIEAPEGVKVPSFNESLRFDAGDVQVVEVKGEPAEDWLGLDD